MLDTIEIKNFKAHQHTRIEFGRLCILSGRNGMGKSSIIQTLLLLRQSYFLQRYFTGLLLAGDLVNIGNSQDAFCDYSSEKTMQFTLAANGKINIMEFNRVNDKNFLPLVDSNKNIDFEDINLFGSDFQYIAAEHLGAKESHKRNTYYVEQLNQMSEKNGDAQYAIHYLSHKADNPIPIKELAHSTSKSPKLKDQVDAWMREISPGVSIIVKENSDINAVSLRYTYEIDNGIINEYKPENVGFGISYILPLLIAILSAPPNALIIIENPESHLHPGGQSVVGKLICKAAQNGIQIIIETHSDHIINSSLIEVQEYSKNVNNGINNANLRIYFVDKVHDKRETVTEAIPVSEIGRIRKAPSNFFDQFSKDMKQIMGF